MDLQARVREFMDQTLAAQRNMPVIMIGMNIIIFCCIGSAVDGVIFC